ncbi:MAG: RIP metalloprotease RseP [Clostridia bacterium]|nr:RIP metalloprotease RseP [Clostridia bacterium]
MLNFLLGVLKVIVLLGTLIFIHEFGHFIVAKFFKIKVHKFSIGFGPKILYKKGKETEYSLRAIPLGGFVQLEGEDVESNDEGSFSNKPIWQRILVLLAGVTVNISFAIIIYLSIYMNVNYYIIPKIASNSNQSSLTKYGLEVGDTIYKVDGKRIYNDYDLNAVISETDKETFLFTLIKADGSKQFKNVTIENQEVGYAGIAFNTDGTVAYTVKNSVADTAKIKPNDKIISINGIQYEEIDDLITAIKSSGGKELKLIVLSDGVEAEKTIKPKIVKRKTFDIELESIKDAEFFENMSLAWNETKSYLRANVEGIVNLIRGNTENVELTGIVGISSEITKTESALEFLYLMSAISLSLGIMNLVPIPGLDGGKILICLIEAVRGKPMSKSVEGVLTLISFSALMILMIYVTIGDISKLFG